MSKQRPFPSSLAQGSAFCNREIERAALKENILCNEHTVVMAPRRYGKTSLITQVISENKFPSMHIDLFLAGNDVYIKKAIQDNASKLIGQLKPREKQATQKLLDLVKRLHPKLTINTFGHQIELSTSQSPERSIVDILLGVNNVAKEFDQQGVIVFDEFQQIGNIKGGHIIEAAIRHAVERSKNITYIFSGSHRHLLDEMFSDKSRPLYHLCELMQLGRIKPESYLKFLKKEFELKWGQLIDHSIMDEILQLTDCHAYYVNALCRKLMKQAQAPTMPVVQQAWSDYVGEQEPWIIKDLDNLSNNQRMILAAIAHQPTALPQGVEFCTKIKSTPSSVKVSLAILLERDFAYQDKDDRYRVLDPATEYYLQSGKYFDFFE